jgi:hypothetical protein
MPGRFLHVTLTFSGASKNREFEDLFSRISQDWIRYAPNCWILFADRTATDVYYFMKIYASPDDQFLILGIDMNERNGWLPAWIWEWIDKKRELGPPPAPRPPPPDYTKTLGDILGATPGSTALTRGLFGMLPAPKPPKDSKN